MLRDRLPLVSGSRVLAPPGGGGGCIGWRAHGDGAQLAPTQCVRQGDAAARPRALGGRGGPYGGADRAHSAQRALRGPEARRLSLCAATYHELPLVPGIVPGYQVVRLLPSGSNSVCLK